MRGLSSGLLWLGLFGATPSWGDLSASQSSETESLELSFTSVSSSTTSDAGDVVREDLSAADVAPLTDAALVEPLPEARKSLTSLVKRFANVEKRLNQWRDAPMHELAFRYVDALRARGFGASDGDRMMVFHDKLQAVVRGGDVEEIGKVANGIRFFAEDLAVRGREAVPLPVERLQTQYLEWFPDRDEERLGEVQQSLRDQNVALREVLGVLQRAAERASDGGEEALQSFLKGLEGYFPAKDEEEAKRSGEMEAKLAELEDLEGEAAGWKVWKKVKGWKSGSAVKAKVVELKGEIAKLRAGAAGGEGDGEGFLGLSAHKLGRYGSRKIAESYRRVQRLADDLGQRSERLSVMLRGLPEHHRYLAEYFNFRGAAQSVLAQLYALNDQSLLGEEGDGDVRAIRRAFVDSGLLTEAEADAGGG